jgi:hypothetical protein
MRAATWAGEGTEIMTPSNRKVPDVLIPIVSAAGCGDGGEVFSAHDVKNICTIIKRPHTIDNLNLIFIRVVTNQNSCTQGAWERFRYGSNFGVFLNTLLNRFFDAFFQPLPI